MELQDTKEPRVKKSIVILSFVSIALVFSTMIMGRYLSSTIDEQGLACRSWPLCPNEFGLPEDRYLIEYAHRVLAVVTSGLVYATAIVVPPGLKKAKFASIIAAIVVSVQIVIRFLTVTTGLYPLIVATHLSTGVTIIAFSLITFLWIRDLNR
jgi:heme A synthase